LWSRYWQSEESKRFPVVCCEPCANAAQEQMAMHRQQEIMRRHQAATQMAAIAPSPGASAVSIPAAHCPQPVLTVFRWF
jgi:hypothetical protein